MACRSRPQFETRQLLKRKLNVGLGFVTGRKSFKNVLRTYLDSWNESQKSAPAQNVALHLLVAYDLAYTNTEIADYAVTDDEAVRAVASSQYISDASIRIETQDLVRRQVLTSREAKLLFGKGYAAKRNAILYLAVKSHLDYLIFLDDDEYPLATVRIGTRDFWTGQPVIATHVKYLAEADITHGRHCGYVSPIPQFEWNDQLSENDFRLFIEAFSNDILNWDSIEELMATRGVTYADRSMLETPTQTDEVPEIDGMKFISASNLGFNLKPCTKLSPFYNPPGARGEDTFLSTSLGDRKVMRIPIYVFHDGFANYQHLLRGALPSTLRAVSSHNPEAASRFLKTCIGWIRYRPMLAYTTNKEGYEAEIAGIQERLAIAIPRMCAYFGTDDFNRILSELEYYHHHVEDHFKDFEDSKIAWAKIMASAENGVLAPSRLAQRKNEADNTRVNSQK
jgi:hypothetical protein